MNKVINYVLIFLSFLMLLISGGFAFIVVGVGVAEYGLSFFLPQFIIMFFTVLLSLVFFIFSLFLLKKKIKQNKKIGYILLTISIISLFFLFYSLTKKPYLDGQGPCLFLSLFLLYLIVFSYKIIRKEDI